MMGRGSVRMVSGQKEKTMMHNFVHFRPRLIFHFIGTKLAIKTTQNNMNMIGKGLEVKWSYEMV